MYRSVSATQLLAQVAAIQAQARPQKRGDVRAHLFAEQQALFDTPERYVTACCGRRAGKTSTVVAMLFDTANKYPGRVSFYSSLSRIQAKMTIWSALKNLNGSANQGGTVNESELTITLPNKHMIVLTGCNDRAEIEKRRGMGIALFVQDECQSVPSYLQNLIDDVIEPALSDCLGRLVMIGTPSLTPGGYWYTQHHTQNPVYRHFYWTQWNNPHILDPDKALQDALARRGVSVDDPSIQREWFGVWIRDEKSAVFPFDAKNHYSNLPIVGGWRYVVGIDIGLRDNDSVIVLAYHPQLPNQTYLVEEHVAPKQDVTDLATKVIEVRDRLGAHNISTMVADAGGLGAKIVEEMRRRYKLPIIPAKKQDKSAHIELLASSIKKQQFYAKPDSRFAAECIGVQWDWEKSTPDRKVVLGHMPDVCDAVLYAYMASLAWNSKAVEPKRQLSPNEEAAAHMARIMAQQQVEQRERDRALLGIARGVGISNWEAIAAEMLDK